MKKLLAVTTFLALCAGTIGVRAFDLQGSDTLKSATASILASCSGATGLRYVGGGSGAGESAVLASTQDIAPMSRFLAGSGTAGVCSQSASRVSKAGGLEIAGDDIGLWSDKGHQSTCDSPSATDTCAGYGNGSDACLSFNKTIPDATVDPDASCPAMNIKSYKDVLRLIYFGLRPTDFVGCSANSDCGSGGVCDTTAKRCTTGVSNALPSLPTDPSNDMSPGATGQRNCRDCARTWLAAHFGQMFQNNCGAGDGNGCTKLQHAFRRDENSGTTDFFRETLNLEAGSQIGNRGFAFCNEYIPRVTQNVATNTVNTTGGACLVGCATDSDCTGGGSGSCTVATGVCSAGTLRLPLCTECNPGCAVNADCGSGGTCNTATGVCSAGTLVNTCPANYQCIPRTYGKVTKNACQRPNYGNGCTVGSSTTDCPSGSACDPGQNMCAKTCTLGGSDTCSASLPGSHCVPAGICNTSTSTAGQACNADADCGGGSGSCKRPADIAAGTGWCAAAVDYCTTDSECGDGTLCDLVSHACSPKCDVGTAGDTKCASFEPGATCGGTSGSEHFCTRVPATNTTWPAGQFCPINAPINGVNANSPGMVAGAPGVYRGAGGIGTTPPQQGYYYENQQDMDPVRRQTIGQYRLPQAAADAGKEPPCAAAEQVSTTCGDLGLVLPISMPPSIVTQADVDNFLPTHPCAFGKFEFKSPSPPLTGTSDHYQLCPNGDMPQSAVWDPITRSPKNGTGDCAYPYYLDASNNKNFQCINGANNLPLYSNPPPASVGLPVALDGRVYNTHVLSVTGDHLSQNYAYNGAQAAPAFATPTGVDGGTSTVFPANTEILIPESGVGAFYRINSTRTTRSGTDSCCTKVIAGNPVNTCCREFTDTNQIGCLVQANTCSTGYAGKGANDIVLTTGNVALSGGSTVLHTQANFSIGLNTASSTTAPACVSTQGPNGCVPAAAGGLKQYPIARNLYVNTINGFADLVGGSAKQQQELALAQCMASSSAKPVYAAAGFVNLSEYACCRDFTEGASCDVRVGTCTAGVCSGNGDCGNGGVCSGGVCTSGACSAGSQCGTSGGVCNNPGVCTAGSVGTSCAANADCGTGGVCTSLGACIGGVCSGNADCGTGGTCSGGVCTGGGCTKNAQCGTDPSLGLCSSDSCSGNATVGVNLPSRDCNF